MKQTNRLLTLFAGLLALALLACPASAGCRAVAVRHNNVVVVKEVVAVAAAIVTPVVAQFVTIPLYSAVYAPSYPAAPAYAPAAPAYQQPAAVAPCDKHAQTQERILSFLEKLDARVANLEGGSSPSPLSKPLRINPMAKVEEEAVRQLPPAGNLLGVMTKNCASCHGDAQKKGGLTLLSGGQLANLTEQQLGSIIDRLTTEDPKRQMPPAGATAMPVGDRLKMISLLVNAPPSK